jgi:hypothetical protein
MDFRVGREMSSSVSALSHVGKSRNASVGWNLSHASGIEARLSNGKTARAESLFYFTQNFSSFSFRAETVRTRRR